MPAILPLTRAVPLLACALTFSLGTTFLQAEPPASLAPVSLLVEEKSATSDSGAAAVPSPTESAVPLPSSFGGPFGERLKLTGDWFGVRDTLAGSGITLDVNLTQFFQGVASGGNDQAFKYGGKIDYFLNIDGKKAGLWKGFFVTMHAETRYGEDVNGIDGMFSFGNFNMAFPKAGRNVTSITRLILSQSVSENFMVFLGKINSLDDFTLNFTSRNGIERFMNSAVVANIINARAVPYSTYGVGFSVLQDKAPVFTFLVRDPDDHPTTSDLNKLFAHGALLSGTVKITIAPLGLPGHQNAGVNWSSRKFTSVDPTSFANIPGQGIVTGQESGSWALWYTFDQYLWISQSAANVGWGVFGIAGISDGNPNPVRWNMTLGVGGTSFIPGRERDIFGIGYFRIGLSSDFKDLLGGSLAPPGLAQRDEQGVEVFYNAALTRWCQLTADLQIVKPSTKNLHTTVLPGMRLKIDF
ncbi:MAG: carbohydrate porin [Verrucomicrobia bacterium]|nr:MAG: carbohydrate porin [Verrucomicrobiota bacterium]